ncbi:MAG: hypothetical protein HY791_16215 [Deltaproteobacteria bacterium]|nr:hypothetical protein [Deltaproteobacteria bacterium]
MIAESRARRARVLRVGLAALALSLLALLAPIAGTELGALAGQVDLRSPHFSSFLYPYLVAPLAVVGSIALVTSPGLMLVLAFHRSGSFESWVMSGYLASVVTISVMTAAAGAFGLSLSGTSFVLALLGMTAVFTTLCWVRSTEVPSDSGTQTAIALIPIVALSMVLGPKLFWESLTGDGAHQLEAARLLLIQPLPFFGREYGPIADYPGTTSFFSILPTSFFVRLFGENEAGVRVPTLYFLVLVEVGIVGLAANPRRPRPFARGLLWAALTVFVVAMGYSATYDPYAADLGLPTAADTAFMAAFFGVGVALVERARTLLFFGTFATLSSSPGGALLMSALFVGLALSEAKRLAARRAELPKRPKDWMTAFEATAWAGLATGVGLLVLAALPSVLAALGLPSPGREHSAEGLSKKLATLILTDVRRFGYVAIPCGLFPLAAFWGIRRADLVSRALLIAAAFTFAFFYALAFGSLHYFVPAMLLPIGAFFRSYSDSLERGPGRWVCVAAAAIGLMLAWPRESGVYSRAREVGSVIDTSQLGSYARMDPSLYRAAEALSILFADDSNDQVPAKSYGVSPLALLHYSATSAREKLFLLAPAGTSTPGFARALDRVGELEGTAVWVGDRVAWERWRADANVPGSRGSRRLEISRHILFGRKQKAGAEFRILEIKKIFSGKRGEHGTKD